MQIIRILGNRYEHIEDHYEFRCSLCDYKINFPVKGILWDKVSTLEEHLNIHEHKSLVRIIIQSLLESMGEPR